MDEREGTAKSAGKHCATASSLDSDAALKCADGATGKILLTDAAAKFNQQFPARATVPHTFVDQTDVQASLADLKAALCKAGSTAKVCTSVTDQRHCVV